MTTGPSQIQPDIRREGPARLTGPESTRGQPRGEGRGEDRKEQVTPQAPKPPEQTREEATTTPKPGNSNNKREEPCSLRRKTTRDHKAKANQTKTQPRQARDARPSGTDPNTPHKRMQAIIREDEHTCPVCGQTYPHSMLKMKLEL
jgi:outer membrane biosynthesis protein TonB